MVKETLTGALFSMPILGLTGPRADPKLILACCSHRKTGQNIEIFTQLLTIPLLPRFPERDSSRKIRGLELDPWKLVEKTNAHWVISVPSYCKIVVYRMASCAWGNVVLMLTSTSPQGRLFNTTH